MAKVERLETKRIGLKTNRPRSNMNNEVSSTSSESTTEFNNLYRARYLQCTQSDNETSQPPKRVPMSRNHYKSTGNINDVITEINTIQNSISNVDLNNSNRQTKKFEAHRIPIVGYEVMEERARFTIYKLKVEDDKKKQSWLVFRRYTDFVRLYTRIKDDHPTLLLPLPGKRWFRDNFEPAFLEERIKALQVFVNAVLDKLPDHPVVREFFCMDEPPLMLNYQPEVQAIYDALEDSITTLKAQLRQKNATINQYYKRINQLEEKIKKCRVCSSL